ncbi:hypothetical protein Tco_0536835 [Tanacetum coccineum]
MREYYLINANLKVRHFHRTMVTSSSSNTISEDKGQMISTEPEIVTVASLKPTHYNKTIEVIMGSCNPMSDSDVVQKYSNLCTWSAGPRSTTALRGTTSIVERNTSDCGKRKLTAYKDPDVFEAYSHLCARNVRPRSSSDLPKAAGVNNFSGKQNSDSDVFQRYAELCAQNATRRFSDNLSDIVRGNSLTKSQPVYNEVVGSVFVPTQGNHLFLCFVNITYYSLWWTFVRTDVEGLDEISGLT